MCVALSMNPIMKGAVILLSGPGRLFWVPCVPRAIQSDRWGNVAAHTHTHTPHTHTHTFAHTTTHFQFPHAICITAPLTNFSTRMHDHISLSAILVFCLLVWSILHIYWLILDTHFYKFEDFKGVMWCDFKFSFVFGVLQAVRAYINNINIFYFSLYCISFYISNISYYIILYILYST